MEINDEYLDNFINSNLNGQIKNILNVRGRNITINNRNKNKVRNILIRKNEILKEIREGNERVRELKQLNITKRKFIQPIQELKFKFEEKLRKEAEKEIRKKIEERRDDINIIKRKIVIPQPVRDSRIIIESTTQKSFIKYRYEYSNIDNIQKLYNAILAEINLLGGSRFVTILYEEIETGKIIKRSIGGDYLNSLEDFTAEVRNIAEGTYGSDVISEEKFQIILNVFEIATLDIMGQGKSEQMLFKTIGVESEKGFCGAECLKLCGIELKAYNEEKKSFKDLIYLRDFIKNNGLNISIISNGFTLNRTCVDIVNTGDAIKLNINDGKRDRLNVVSLLEQKDITPVYLYKNEGSKFTIIYDEINKHFDVIDKIIELKDNVYLSLTSNVIMNQKIVFTPRQINKNNFKETDMPVEYLFFDYETVIDFKENSCMKPYSISFLKLSPFELENLERFDREKNIEEVNKIRKDKCITFLGFDCNYKFIKWFLENQNDKVFILIGFNNTNFDNFLLLDGFLKYKETDQKVEYSIREVFFNGSQLLSFKINGRHTQFDIRKHLIGSLKKNCESFQIECCAKKSFDHNKAQQLYLKGELIDFITGNEELKEYNEYDVLATAVLYQKYVNALNEIPSAKKYAKNIYKVKTIGSLIYKIFGDNKESKNIKFPKLDFKQYNDLQKSKIAGRVEMFNGVQKINERLASTDVCSLYPFVMAVLNVFYPCGDKLENVDTYRGDDVLGFYYCDIDQSNLKENNLPNIYAEKLEVENKWDSKEVLKDYLISNVMIGLLRKYKCKVVIKKGFIFTKQMKSCEMFDFLLDFMKCKNEEDTKCKNKDLSYNPAIREVYKLLMNSLSGKVIEGLHTEKTKDVDSIAEYLKIKDDPKTSKINFINAIGNKMFITYEINEEDICEEQQRPIFLGVFIYDYAKRYMYEYSYSKIGLDRLLYTDTDASKFRYTDFNKWKKWVEDNNIQVPHWEEVEAKDPRYKNHLIYNSKSKVFGSFEDELEKMTGDEYTFYCLEKKSWLYSTLKNGKENTKYRFKGLNDNAQLLTLNENFINKKETKHKDGSIEIKYNLKEDSDLEVYQYYNNNTCNNIGNSNEIKFFETIYNTGVCYVLCSSFRKIVKNSSRNVEMSDTGRYNSLMNKIQVCYCVKKIRINI